MTPEKLSRGFRMSGILISNEGFQTNWAHVKYKKSVGGTGKGISSSPVVGR